VAQQKKLTKGKAALLVVLAAGGTILSAMLLHGWQIYAGFAMVGVVLLVGFLGWNQSD